MSGVVSAVWTFGVSCALASACLAQSAAQVQPAPDGHPKIAPERLHRYERQDVVLDDFQATGYVLDIGGGGEGIIGLLKPTQVVAIDISERELAEAPPGPLKIVMDATDLKFLDNTFSTATSFFTLMYMNPDTQRRAIEEVHRVLAPGGRFLVWEVTLPARTDTVQDVAVFPLRIRMPGREVTTGYGTFFPDVVHDATWFAVMLRDAGFEIVTERAAGGTFYLEARKRPDPPPDQRSSRPPSPQDVVGVAVEIAAVGRVVDGSWVGVTAVPAPKRNGRFSPGAPAARGARGDAGGMCPCAAGRPRRRQCATPARKHSRS